MTKKYYLKQNIQAEPLVNFWYAWTYLISPATASMVIANSQSAIMKSYIEQPELHEDAVKRPEMLGGPFMDFEVRQVDSIKKLRDETRDNCSKLFDLAEAIRKLTTILKTTANGHSLELIYSMVPSALRGLVELIYDIDNKASFRFIESLLYESEFNLSSFQSVLLTEINKDFRPYALSTPRLPQHNQVHIKLPFASSLYDTLFAMKNLPQSIEEINSFLDLLPNVNEIDRDLFLSFFTENSPIPKKMDSLAEKDLKIRYLGHACILIESIHCSILIDPVLSYKYQDGSERYTYDDLPEKIDYLVITHAHLDHVLIEHLIQLRHKVKKVIVPKSGVCFLQDPSLKLFFKHLGFQDVVEIDDMETILIPGGSITGIPFLGEHGDLNIQTKKAHLVKINGKTVLCAADSNNISNETYMRIRKIVGEIDVIFIGMECDGAPLSWVYGSLYVDKLPRSMDQSRRLNGSDFKKAFNIVECFDCKQAYVYAMGQESWLNYVMCVKYTSESKPIIESDKFVSACRDKGMKSKRLLNKEEIYL